MSQTHLRFEERLKEAQRLIPIFLIRKTMIILIGKITEASNTLGSYSLKEDYDIFICLLPYYSLHEQHWILKTLLQE